MRKPICLIAALACAFVLACGWAAAEEGEENPWPESEHPYSSNMDQTWSYQHPDAAPGLRVTFSAETEVENKYDFLTVTDSRDNAVEYTGTSLAGRTLILPGGSFTIRLTSDGSVQKYGFAVTDIRPLTQEEYEDLMGKVTGSCGENVVWTMDPETDTLTVSGTGPMEEYAALNDGGWALWSPPFWSWDQTVSVEASRRRIRHIVVEQGVTSIGGGAFRDLDGLESIEIASTVTRIGPWAFDKTTGLEEITLPAGITIIDDSTFSDCSSLRSVNIPQGVQSIGPWAFFNTAIESIALPSGITVIDEHAFTDCSLLESISLPANLQTIGPFAFSGISATEITLPANVATVGERAFYECGNLKNVYVSADNPNFKSVDGVLFTKDGAELICYGVDRTAASYQVPDGVRTVRASAFSYNKTLQEVRLPDSLLTLQDWAFGHTGLERIVLPQHVQRLGDNAFGECFDITEATLPVSLTEIGAGVFKGCSLADVYYEGTEDDWAEVSVGDDNGVLLGATFWYESNPYCPHTDMIWHPEIPRTCTTDGAIAHWECGLCGNLFLDQAATERARNIVIPASHDYRSSVTTEPTCSEPGVRTYTCIVCSANTEGHSFVIEIPPTGAHRYVGGRCVNLRHDGVTECGHVQPGLVAAGKCGYTGNMDNFINIVLYGNETLNYDRLCGDTVIWYLDSDGTLSISGRGPMCTCIVVLRGNSYGGTSFGFISSPWYDYRSQIKRVVIDPGVTGIGLRCFYNCSQIESIELPNTLTRIAADAFYNTGSLQHVYYSGTSAQWDEIQNSGLDTEEVTMHFVEPAPIVPDLVLPASTTEIGSEAFRGISAKIIYIPASVQEIAGDAFDDDATLMVAADSPAETYARTFVFRYIPY